MPERVTNIAPLNYQYELVESANIPTPYNLYRIDHKKDEISQFDVLFFYRLMRKNFGDPSEIEYDRTKLDLILPQDCQYSLEITNNKLALHCNTQINIGKAAMESALIGTELREWKYYIKTKHNDTLLVQSERHHSEVSIYHVLSGQTKEPNQKSATEGCPYKKMNYEPDRHHRRSMRLKGYDYSEAGTYFVTVCAQNRECLFGDVVDGEMRLNDAGQMVQNIWNDLPARYPDVETDEFVVMPNHLHGIIVIVGAPLVGAHSFGTDAENRAGTRPAPTLGDVVSTFKSITTHQYTDGVRLQHWPAFNGRLWQRNYYEHIIRSEEEMDRIRTYIVENPAKWDDDEDNPEKILISKSTNSL